MPSIFKPKMVFNIIYYFLNIGALPGNAQDNSRLVLKHCFWKYSESLAVLGVEFTLLCAKHVELFLQP